MKLRFALVAMSLGLVGCNQYWERSDAAATSAGDAVASNMALQMVDPWPAYARNNNIPADGERMQRAVERYRSGGSAGSSATPGPSSP